MNKLILFSIIFILVVTCPTMVFAEEWEMEKDYRVDYTDWDYVLKTYVNAEGLVNYQGLKENRNRFDRFIQQIEEINPYMMSTSDQIAFWINAYNAITVKLILDHYPVKSIRRINFGLVWNIPRKVARRKLSLGHIEQKILRPIDARIHFAINCASMGCPVLMNEPYTADELKIQWSRQAKRFINDPTKVRLDKENNILYVSAIFSWFKRDFLRSAGSIVEYIYGYLDNQEDVDYLKNNRVKIKTLKYDWALNEQK